MTTVQLTLNLSDNLAQAARQAGLLTPEAIERLLIEAVRRQAIDVFFEATDQLAADDIPPITLEEIQAEVNTVCVARKMDACLSDNIDSLSKYSKQQQNEAFKAQAQSLAVQALIQVQSGVLDYISKLWMALKTQRQRSALVQWVEHFSPLRWDIKKEAFVLPIATKKSWGIEYGKDKNFLNYEESQRTKNKEISIDLL